MMALCDPTLIAKTESITESILMSITDVVGQYLEDDQPKFADCRNLLRSGPASSLRINIRAVSDF